MSVAGPQVSVVMPAFNAAATIREAIASVLAQTYRDFELLVIDDGSTDATPDIVAGIADRRVRLVSGPRGGPSAARNRGLMLSTAEFVAFLDADDLWTPDKLAGQIEALRSDPEAALAYSWTDCIDEEGRFLRHGSHVHAPRRAYELLVTRNFLDNGSTPMIRRAALPEAGAFDEGLQRAEDWDLWLRLAHAHPFVCVPKVQVLYRVSASSNSADVTQQCAATVSVLHRALARVHPEACRRRLERTAMANVYKYVAVRLVETADSRRAGMEAAGYWRKFVSTTPTPFRHLGKALLIGGGVLAILVLSPAQVRRLRRWASLTLRRAGGA